MSETKKKKKNHEEYTQEPSFAQDLKSVSCNGCDPHSEVFLALRVPEILARHSFHGGLPDVFVEQRQKP